MSKKNKKGKKSPPSPKLNLQISRSSIRPFQPKGPDYFMQKAREYPIYGCWIMDEWQDAGLTPVVVARKQDNDRIMFGVYLVDYYCLGVKSVHIGVDYTRNHFNRDLPKMCADAPVPCSVELAHELIYGAIEYAQSLGFEPTPDFYNQKADQLLDPPDAHPRTGSVTFGKDGKPFYVAGPYDGELKSRFVLSTLSRTVGPGNFDYMIALGDIPDDVG